MSQQAFWLFLKMDKRNLFVQMALQCAPVLAGIKVSIFRSSRKDTGRNCVFCCAIPKYCARKLCRCRDKITLLLYRREELEQWVKRYRSKPLQKEIGYDSVEAAPDFQKTGTADRRARKR